ncbi:MAG: PRC-barrel domain containing protein, partial [Mesorhizobium sp.]
IMFAVIGFGGFLGMGEKYHAIPWATLDYDEDQGGYVVPFTKEQLQAAPAYSIEELTGADGEAARDASFQYYHVKPYWH